MKDLSIKTWCLLHFFQVASMDFLSLTKTSFGRHHHLLAIAWTLESPAKKVTKKSLFLMLLWLASPSSVSSRRQECPQSTARMRVRTQVGATNATIYRCRCSCCREASYCCHPAGNCIVEKSRTSKAGHCCTGWWGGGDTVTFSYLDPDIEADHHHK